MSKLRINLGATLTENQNYYVTMDEGFLVDKNTGLPLPGVTDPNLIKFQANPVPVLINTTPVDNYSDFQFGLTSPTKRIDITFTQPVKKGTGFIRLFEAAGSSIENFDVTSNVIFTIDSPVVTLYTTNFLVEGTTYYIMIDDGAVVDVDCFSNREIDSRTSPEITVDYNWQTPTDKNLQNRSQVRIQFCQPIITLTGNVSLYRNDVVDELIEVKDVTGIAVVEGDALRNPGVNDTLQFTPLKALVPGETYYVTAPRGVVGDSKGFSYKAIVKGDTDVIQTFTTAKVKGDIILQFNRPVVAGTGFITLYRQVTNEVIKKYNVEANASWINDTDPTVPVDQVVTADDIVDFTGERITLNIEVEQGEAYYLLIDSTAVTDRDGLPFAGISSAATFDWSMYDGPTINSVAQTAVDVVAITFNERVVSKGNNENQFYIHLDSDDSLTKTFNVPADVTVVNETVTVDPDIFDEGRDYYLLSDSETFENIYQYVFQGVPTKLGAPTFATTNAITSQVPANNSLSAADLGTTGFSATFDRTIVAGSGNMVLHRTLDDSIVQSFDVATDLTVGTNSLTGVVTAALVDGVGYYFLMDAGIVTDVDGITFKGLTDKTKFNFVTSGLDITTTVPLDDATGINDINTNGVAITFNNNIFKLAGTITLNESSGPTVIQTFDVVTQTAISGATITTNPVTPILTPNTGYHVLMDANAVEDTNNVAYNGIVDPTVFNFTTDAGPVMTATAPVSGVTDVRNLDMSITFDQNVLAGSGNFTLYKTIGDIPISSWAVGTLQIVNNVITIPNVDVMEPLTDYYVKIDSTAVYSAATNIYFAGINDTTTWNFTTGETGITSYYPAHQEPAARDVSQFVLSFDKYITANVGNFYLKKTVGDVLMKTWDITTDVSIVNNVLTLPNDVNLDPTANYYIEADANVVVDSDNIYYGGIAGSTTWNFTTGVVAISNLNPADGSLAVRQTDFVITFDDVVTGIPAKTYSLVETGVGFVKLWTVGDADIVFSGNTITLTNDAVLKAGTDYYLQSDLQAAASKNILWDGMTDQVTWNFTTGAETTITVLSPIDGSTNSRNFTPSISFANNVGVNAGNMYLKRTSDDVIMETFSTASVVVLNDTITIPITVDLVDNIDYYLVADTNFIYDTDASILFTGLTDKTLWNFSYGLPQVSTMMPLDNAINVDLSEVSLTLDSNIVAGVGNIDLYETGVGIVDTFDITTADVTIVGNKVTLNNIAALTPLTDYHIIIPNNVLVDDHNIAFAGLLSSTDWNFTLINTPVISTTVPVNNAANEGITELEGNYSFTFDQLVTPNVGNFYLKRVSDGTVLRTWGIADATVSFDGSDTFTFTVVGDTNLILDDDDYYFEVDANVATGKYTNFTSTAITGNTAWRFTVTAGLWDVSTTFVESAKSFSNTVINEFEYSDDGSKVYILTETVAGVADGLYQYSLSTPWDISTAVSDNKSLINIPGDRHYRMFFKSDGTKVYMQSDLVLNQYSLSTPWDISTAVSDNKSYSPSNNGQYGGCFMATDDATWYVTDPYQNEIRQYVMATPGDISTSTKTGTAVAVGVNDIYIRPDGLRAFQMQSDTIAAYSMATPWDITTMSPIASNTRNTGTQDPGAMTFKTLGDKFYVSNGSGITGYSI